jgi:hypothetical protein
MENLTKLNYLSSLSFIIISVFLYITLNGYQSVSAQEIEEEQEEPSEINREKEEEEVESSNDIFSDLSRNLPSIDKDIPNDNAQPLDSEEPLFGNPDTEEFDENNEISSNSENIVESNEQGTTSESIEKSFSNGLSNSAQEPDIINEDDSSSSGNTKTSSSSSSRNEVSNDEANNNNIVDPSD